MTNLKISSSASNEIKNTKKIFRMTNKKYSELAESTNSEIIRISRINKNTIKNADKFFAK